MRKRRFDEARIIGVLREQKAGGTTDEVCRRHGISQQMFYRWNKEVFSRLAEARLVIERWRCDRPHSAHG